MAISYDFIASYTAPSNQTYITFNNIPQTYTHLYLKAIQRSNRGAGDDGAIQSFYNNSQAADYNWSSLYVYSASTLSQSTQANQTFNNIEGMTQATSGNSNQFGFYELFIPNYSSSTRNKPSLQFALNAKLSNPGGLYAEGAGYRNVTTAISRIDLMTNTTSSQFVAGSSYFLYGIKNA